MCATMGGAVSFGVAKLFLIDIGWSLDAVGTLSGTGNILMILAGCAIASVTVLRYGPGTDYSVFQGLQTLGEIIAMAGATVVAGRAGYGAALGIGLLIAIVLMAGMLPVRKKTGQVTALDEAAPEESFSGPLEEAQ